MISKIITRILVLCNDVPKPDQNSGDRRFFEILKILSKLYTCDIWITEDNRNKVNNQSYLANLALLHISIITDKEKLETHIIESYYDFVIVEFYWMAIEMRNFLHLIPNKTTLIVDTVDVHFVRESLSVKYNMLSRDKFEKNKRQEIKTYNKCQAVIVVSEDEMNILIHSKVRNPMLFVIPNIVPDQPLIDYNASLNWVIFVGGFNWYPNTDGILWFIEKIWPLVTKINNNAELIIIGSNPTNEILNLRSIMNVIILGFVADTSIYLKQAAISIAPLRVGGGMKGKINEALSFGLPVVTTSVGAQGFKATSGKEMIIADEPQDFADAINLLLKDPALRKTIGQNGNAMNQTICSPDQVERRISQMVESLHRNKRKEFGLRKIISKIYPSILVHFLKHKFFRNLWNFIHSKNKKVVLLSFLKYRLSKK